jgi:hypothetical protein
MRNNFVKALGVAAIIGLGIPNPVTGEAAHNFTSVTTQVATAAVVDWTVGNILDRAKENIDQVVENAAGNIDAIGQQWIDRAYSRIDQLRQDLSADLDRKISEVNSHVRDRLIQTEQMTTELSAVVTRDVERITVEGLAQIRSVLSDITFVDGDFAIHAIQGAYINRTTIRQFEQGGRPRLRLIGTGVGANTERWDVSGTLFIYPPEGHPEAFGIDANGEVVLRLEAALMPTANISGEFELPSEIFELGARSNLVDLPARLEIDHDRTGGLCWLNRSRCHNDFDQNLRLTIEPETVALLAVEHRVGAGHEWVTRDDALTLRSSTRQDVNSQLQVWADLPVSGGSTRHGSVSSRDDPALIEGDIDIQNPRLVCPNHEGARCPGDFRLLRPGFETKLIDGEPVLTSHGTFDFESTGHRLVLAVGRLDIWTRQRTDIVQAVDIPVVLGERLRIPYPDSIDNLRLSGVSLNGVVWDVGVTLDDTGQWEITGLPTGWYVATHEAQTTGPKIAELYQIIQ